MIWCILNFKMVDYIRKEKDEWFRIQLNRLEFKDSKMEEKLVDFDWVYPKTQRVLIIFWDPSRKKTRSPRIVKTWTRKEFEKLILDRIHTEILKNVGKKWLILHILIKFFCETHRTIEPSINNYFPIFKYNLQTCTK